MPLINLVTLEGRVVYIGELIINSLGQKSIYFGVIHSKPPRKPTKEKPVVEIRTPLCVPCIATEKNAEKLVKYYSKGIFVSLQGHLDYRKYITKIGDSKTEIFVSVENLNFLSKVEYTEKN